MSDADLIVLVLKPLPDTVPVSIRLRALLKTALRRDKLRCVDLKEPPGTPQRPVDARSPAPVAPEATRP